MRTQDLHLLRDLVEQGSFGRLAALRGLSVSTVARRIDALEADLGLALLERRPDGVRLTSAGRSIAAAARPLVAAAEDLVRLAGALRSEGEAPVVVSATEPVATEILAPALPRLWQAAPRLKIDLRSQASVVSLARREADLAVRMARPEGASLVVRKLADLGLGLFASRAYLAGRSPADLRLAEQRLAAYDDSFGPIPELDWLADPELAKAVVFRTSSTRALLMAALAGSCVSLLPRIMAERAGLVAVPESLPAPQSPAWLVMHPDLRRRPDVAAVRRWIVESFAARTRPYRSTPSDAAR